MLMNETPKYRYTLPLDLQLFAGGEGGEGGEGGGNEPKTYTEEEVQARIKEATSSAVEKAIKKRFGDLGDMDLEELKAAVSLKKKADEEKQKQSKGKDDDKIDPSELEAKLEEKLKAKEKEQSDKMFKRLLTAEVKVLASELEFADWEDALALADLSEVKEDDNGNLIGVKEALEELSKKKPHLLKQKHSGRFGADVKPNQQQKNDRLESIKKLAQNRGQTVEMPNDPWKKN